MFNNLKTKVKISKAYARYALMRDQKKTAKNSSGSSLTERPVWAFNAGDTFTGNPKWLFVYVNKYRPDIRAYWICDSEETVKFVRSLGYEAWQFGTTESVAIQSATSVFVVEQVKEIIPVNMSGVILLNLYHGVGCKTVEKKVRSGFLAERIAAKYIQNNKWYQEHMLFLVSSPLMEKHFTAQMDLEPSHLIRAGYPKCLYQKYYEKIATFNHNILKGRDLPEDTRIAAWVPTYRDDPSFDFWPAALPDVDALLRRLEETHTLLIFKVHPRMENDARYIWMKETYSDNPYFLFWDNRKDFYEILDRIDLGIIDYSSIFYDMLSGGVSHFIRYFFDYDNPENRRDFVFDLKEMTCGTLCETFDSFLAAFDRSVSGGHDDAPRSAVAREKSPEYEAAAGADMPGHVASADAEPDAPDHMVSPGADTDASDRMVSPGADTDASDRMAAPDADTDASADENEDEIRRIEELFWAYADEDSMDRIVDAALSFVPHLEQPLKTLYSFDIFDTLIARKVLVPEGIFFGVRERMLQSSAAFPAGLISRYPSIRSGCERNVREYYSKRAFAEGDYKREISYASIFERMASLYNLTDYQIRLLMDWELELEYENCIPLEETIALVKELKARGETVILVSDMYLEESFIRNLLVKADPLLGELPLFLSSTWGVQKTTRQLYIQAYLSFDNYNFGEWIHYGDSVPGDKNPAQKLGIRPVLHYVPSFNAYEKELAESIGTYDAYLVAAQFARMRQTRPDAADYYAYAYASLYLVPYVHWALEDAVNQGYKTLYFISRDGYHLKEIADALINKLGIDMKTRYVYGSRKAWRIPSFIEDLDDEFFTGFGNLGGVNSYSALLNALLLTDQEFSEMFPSLGDLKKAKVITAKQRNELAALFKVSPKYRRHILALAAQQRPIVEEYIRQETDFSEPFAFVEYWGRGYTQECHTRLLRHAAGDEGSDLNVPYYYVRSIYPSDPPNIRHNFSDDPASLIFVEALFANLPYKSVEAYTWENDRVVPIIEPQDYYPLLHEALSRQLPRFAEFFAGLGAINLDALRQDLYRFSLSYLNAHPEDPILSQMLGRLKDSVTLYGKHREFAPAVSDTMLKDLASGQSVASQTSSVELTLARSTPEMTQKFLHETVDVPAEKKENSRIWHRDLQLTELNIASLDILSRIPSESSALQKQYNEYAAAISSPKDVFILDITRSEERELLGSLPSLLSSGGLSDPVYADENEEICGSHLLYFEKAKASDYALARKDEVLSKKTRALTSRDAKDASVLLSALARARVIFTVKMHPVFNMIRLRPETRVIRISRFAVPFPAPSPFASMEEIPKTLEQLYLSRITDNVSSLTVSGPGGASMLQRGLYEGIAKRGQNGRILNTGMPVTDIYFDEAYRGRAKSALQKAFPASRGRKIIFYRPAHGFIRPDMVWRSEQAEQSCEVQLAPAQVYRRAKGRDAALLEQAGLPVLRHLDLALLRDLIGDTHVVVLCSPAPTPEEGYHVPASLSDFAMDLRSVLTPRQIAMNADIIVGEDTELFLESAILGKPMLRICDDAPAAGDSAADAVPSPGTPGIPDEVLKDLRTLPLVRDAFELAAAVRSINGYDDKARKALCGKYLSYCKGRSCLALARTIQGMPNVF